MMTLTTAAWKRLSHLQSSRPEISALRLKLDDGRIKCQKGIQRRHDQVLNQPGRPTLLLAPAIAKTLADRTLDAPKTKHGRRLRLTPQDVGQAAQR